MSLISEGLSCCMVGLSWVVLLSVSRTGNSARPAAVRPAPRLPAAAPCGPSAEPSMTRSPARMTAPPISARSTLLDKLISWSNRAPSTTLSPSAWAWVKGKAERISTSSLRSSTALSSSKRACTALSSGRRPLSARTAKKRRPGGIYGRPADGCHLLGLALPGEVRRGHHGLHLRLPNRRPQQSQQARPAGQVAIGLGEGEGGVAVGPRQGCVLRHRT